MEHVTVLNPTAIIGEKLLIKDDEIEITNRLINAFAYNNKTIADVKAMFKSISISYEYNFYTEKIELFLNFVTFDNFQIKIGYAKDHLIEKVNLMIALIPESYKHYGTDVLVINMDPNNVANVYKRYEKISNE